MAQKLNAVKKGSPGPVKVGPKKGAKNVKKSARAGTFSADKFAKAKKKVFGV